eukprot:746152-Hanusia_phi.AAC.14
MRFSAACRILPATVRASLRSLSLQQSSAVVPRCLQHCTRRSLSVNWDRVSAPKSSNVPPLPLQPPSPDAHQQQTYNAHPATAPGQIVPLTNLPPPQASRNSPTLVRRILIWWLAPVDQSVPRVAAQRAISCSAATTRARNDPCGVRASKPLHTVQPARAGRRVHGRGLATMDDEEGGRRGKTRKRRQRRRRRREKESDELAHRSLRWGRRWCGSSQRLIVPSLPPSWTRTATSSSGSPGRSIGYPAHCT